MKIQPTTSPEPWITAEDAAQHVGLAIGTLYNKCTAGEIPHRKMGRLLRFRRSELDAWMEEQHSGESR